MKRLNMIDAYSVNTERNNYIVTLERTKNDINGNPRYKAVIIALGSGTTNYYNAVYTFQGHYTGEAEEARWIVSRFEKETEK